MTAKPLVLLQRLRLGSAPVAITISPDNPSCSNMRRMTSKEITAILDRVRAWPEKRQEDLARIALELEAQDASWHSLSDEQVEEVRRIRREVRAGKIATDEEMAQLWKQCGL